MDLPKLHRECPHCKQELARTAYARHQELEEFVPENVSVKMRVGKDPPVQVIWILLSILDWTVMRITFLKTFFHTYLAEQKMHQSL